MNSIWTSPLALRHASDRARWKGAIKGAIVGATLAAGSISPDRSTRVLLYHRIEPVPRVGDPWSVSLSDFERQIAELKLLGYRAVGCEGLATVQPSRSVVLAFDDGFRSALEHGVPVLRAAGYPATFLLVPAAMGGTSSWEADTGIEPSPVMSWPEAESLRRAGMQIGVHSLTHADLQRATDAELTREVVSAKALAEDRLGIPIVTFSVPFGHDDPRLDARLLKAGYRYKLGNAEVAPSTYGALTIRPSIAILNGDSLREFRRKLAGGYDWVNAYRRLRKRFRAPIE